MTGYDKAMLQPILGYPLEHDLSSNVATLNLGYGSTKETAYVYRFFISHSNPLTLNINQSTPPWIYT